MTIKLELSTELKERLQLEAARRGTSSERLAVEMLDKHLPGEPNQVRRDAVRRMLELWRSEDESMTGEESELNAAVMKSIDEHRSSFRRLYQDIL